MPTWTGPRAGLPAAMPCRTAVHWQLAVVAAGWRRGARTGPPTGASRCPALPWPRSGALQPGSWPTDAAPLPAGAVVTWDAARPVCRKHAQGAGPACCTVQGYRGAAAAGGRQPARLQSRVGGGVWPTQCMPVHQRGRACTRATQPMSRPGMPASAAQVTRPMHAAGSLYCWALQHCSGGFGAALLHCGHKQGAPRDIPEAWEGTLAGQHCCCTPADLAKRAQQPQYCQSDSVSGRGLPGAAERSCHQPRLVQHSLQTGSHVLQTVPACTGAHHTAQAPP